MNKEVANKSELLQESEKTIENQNAKIEKSEKELSEKSELLKEVQELIENQNVLLSLNDESLLTTPSKFKSFKAKTVNKFQQFQQLVKKPKVQTQEFIAQIEVKVN